MTRQPHRPTQLDRIEAMLHAILRGERRIHKDTETMSKELDDLKAEVAAEETVGDSLVTLVEGLAAQLVDAGTDPVALKAITDDLKAHADTWAAAVAANTPPAPPAA